ncbi:transporter substrate-binding domain-containing protein [Pseudogemmobacter faecipullorum]|uniref:Transporter substrate-binding domain-containing protein n=1 Tax=Pseudogemmobacter faecipullorum TaxID=2755041 RepID=A0ABS8CR70_9RHOB|nr:transporter substrate-binding domain-containing protein [Pseudogemmobacter faecipullorum]MCB5411906.1 transporter substrate-binding domain-containing protein [Pseudogemmobacter faecipullorum]
MKKLLLATALTALSLGAAAAETIRIGTEGAYEPFNFINDAGELAGFEIILGTELCKRAGLDCVFVKNDWDSIIPNLQSSNYDAIMAGMSITPERLELINFSENYTQPTPSAYAAMSPDTPLTEGVVSAQVGTIQAAYVAASGAQLLEFATPDESVAAVRNGQAQAVMADKDYVLSVVGDGLEIVGEDVLLGGGIGIGLRKSDTELKAKFDKAIQEMKADGSLNTLITEWFGEEGIHF